MKKIGLVRRSRRAWQADMSSGVLGVGGDGGLGQRRRGGAGPLSLTATVVMENDQKTRAVTFKALLDGRTAVLRGWRGRAENLTPGAQKGDATVVATYAAGTRLRSENGRRHGQHDDR